jgi:hypothetical protein
VKNVDGVNFDFELYSKYDTIDNGRGYVATGFSRDIFMNDDTVLFCNPVTGVELYWTSHKHADPVGDNSGLTLNSLLSQDGALWCSVTRIPALTFLTPTAPPAEETNDLNAESFYWLASTGHLADDEDVATKHDWEFVGNLVNFNV